MDKSYYLNRLAILSFCLPLSALFLVFMISAANGSIPWCFPLTEGCASISRAARQGASLDVFRLIMIPSAFIICCFWYLAAAWLKDFGEISIGTANTIRYLGAGAAFILIFYLLFLGTKGDIYSFMRRFGIIGYFAGTGIAQILFLQSLDKLSGKTANVILRKFRNILFSIIALMLILAFSQAVISSFFPSDSLDNIIEWNYAVLMHSFFLICGIFTRRLSLRLPTAT